MDSWKKILIVSIVLLFLCLTVFVWQLKKAGTSVVERELAADLELGPCGNEDRLEAVKDLFIKMGADEADLRVEKFERAENLIITKKGRTPDEIIIVGAHYDKTGEGCGAIDNWTGIVILANLYRAIKDSDTEKTYKFTAFGAEEKGLVGSRAMAGEITEENLKNYCAMVNFDSFGFSYPQAMGNNSDKNLIKLGENVAKDLDISLTSADIAGADADSTPFNDRSIPAITFHGMSDNWKNYLHTKNDKLENIKLESVYIGYRFGLSFLNKIEADNCAAFR